MHPVATVGINSSNVKMRNISAILLSLLQNDGMSRVHLAQTLGVSSATITNLVTELADAGFVVEKGYVKTDGQVGRRQRVLELVPDSRYAVGVHMDVGTVHVGITNNIGQIVKRASFSHQLNDSWQTVLTQVSETVNQLTHSYDGPVENIVGLGFAASGLVNTETGVNVFAPNLSWHDVPIQHYLQQCLSFPVVVENNVRAMALGEAMFGDIQSTSAMAFVYGRVGVGAGLVVNGQLYRGAGAGAGEIGHMMFVIDNHRPLPLEKIVSEAAICQNAQEITGQRLNLDTIVEQAQNGDLTLQELLKDRAFYIGLALANLVNILNPDVIVIGGMFQQGGSLMLDTIRDTVRRYAFANLGERVTMIPSTFKADAGIVGSSALALDAYFYRPTLSMAI